MDDAEKTAALVRRNRELLARASAACAAAREASATAEWVLEIALPSRIEREHLNALHRDAVRKSDDA